MGWGLPLATFRSAGWVRYVNTLKTGPSPQMDYKFLGGELPLVNFRSAGWVRCVKRTKDVPFPQIDYKFMGGNYPWQISGRLFGFVT